MLTSLLLGLSLISSGTPASDGQRLTREQFNQLPLQARFDYEKLHDAEDRRYGSLFLTPEEKATVDAERSYHDAVVRLFADKEYAACAEMAEQGLRRYLAAKVLGGAQPGLRDTLSLLYGFASLHLGRMDASVTDAFERYAKGSPYIRRVEMLPFGLAALARGDLDAARKDLDPEGGPLDRNNGWDFPEGKTATEIEAMLYLNAAYSIYNYDPDLVASFTEKAHKLLPKNQYILFRYAQTIGMQGRWMDELDCLNQVVTLSDHGRCVEDQRRLALFLQDRNAKKLPLHFTPAEAKAAAAEARNYTYEIFGDVTDYVPKEDAKPKP